MNRHSLFIVGCGRNGTSLTAGLFRNSGLFMGRRLHAPSPENPTGYFEDANINRLNNRIISRYVPSKGILHDGISYQCDSPGTGNGWLARIPLQRAVEATAEEEAEIRSWLQSPFCLKDTRFCYLLHLWRRHAPDAHMICVFRPPHVAAASILHSCFTRAGLADHAISVKQAFEIWTLMYTHVLRRHAQTGDWLFVQYADIISGRALDAIEKFAGSPVDRHFACSALNRTQPPFEAPESALSIFAELQERARNCY